MQTYSKLLGFFEGYTHTHTHTHTQALSFLFHSVYLPVCSDLAKRRSTLEKLVALHKSLSQVEDVLSCYSSLLAMTNRGSSDKEEEEEEEGGRTQLWLEAVAYILSVEPTQLTEQAWEMVSMQYCVYSSVTSLIRTHLGLKILSSLAEKYAIVFLLRCPLQWYLLPGKAWLQGQKHPPLPYLSMQFLSTLITPH